jgi:hypothetical protein
MFTVIPAVNAKQSQLSAFGRKYEARSSKSEICPERSGMDPK